MTIEITIDETELAQLILTNSAKIGSTEWDIYVDESGCLDLRHNTHKNDGWIEIIDFYTFWDDAETLSCSKDELGRWLKSDALDLNSIAENENENRCPCDLDDLVEIDWAERKRKH